MEKWFYEMYGMPYSLFTHNIYCSGKLRYEIFVIAEIEKIQDYSNFTNYVANHLNLPAIRILLNSQGKPFSNFLDNWYVVLVGENEQMELSHIQTIHELGKNDSLQISIDEITERWVKRLNHIEENILPTLPALLKYEELLVSIYIAISIGESAIHYLRYIGKVALPACLTHARLSYFDSFYVLNPLYIKVDHECRDYIELYNAKRIELNVFQEQIKHYTQDELLYTIARLLYPTLFFDYLEELFISQEWELKYTYDLEADMKRKSELVLAIMQMYQLPLISYLFSFLS